MKKLIYFASVLMLMICLASCGKSQDPTPSGTSSGGNTQPQPSGNGGY
jgi:hypothetical protein